MATTNEATGAVEEVDDPRPSSHAQPVRPALEVLQLDQRELIDTTDDRLEDRPTPAWDLRRGFPTRRALVSWYQRAVIRTLGHLPDALPPEALLREDSLLQALIVGSGRETFADGDPISKAHAREKRRQVEDQQLLPAAKRAYDDLRGAAGEYIEVLEDDTDRDPMDFDPEQQAELAMRPAFSHLDQLQQSALQALWGGFEDRDALRDWFHGLNRAANGQVEPDLPKRTMTDHDIVACLLDERDDQYSRRVRERYAIVEVLPAFVDAIETMETGELAKRRRTTAQTYQFGE